ncbi:hypothetical protein ACROYT_G004537 [Oculina patagonica]
MSAKRKGRPTSLSDSAASPEEKRSCRESSVSEIRSEMSANDPETLSAVELLSKKMDTVLSKLQKLDNIESRLDNLFKAVSNIEDAVANLDKEVHNLKEKMKNTNKTVKELEESVDFNDEEIANLKRDVKAAQNRRENLMFIGIEEHNTTEQDEQGTRHEVENTKEIIYKFMEDELQISNPRDKIEFQRIHRVGKPKDDGPRPVIARFLRYSDRELVLRQDRKTLKDKDFNVFEDIPKELYELRKSQNKKFKDAKARGCSVYFSKRFPDKLYVNGKFIPSNAPL